MMIVNRGDTFSASGSASLIVNGLAQKDMTGWSISGLVNLFNGITKALECNWLDITNSTFYMRQLDTSDWPKGQATVWSDCYQWPNSNPSNHLDTGR